MRLQFSWILVMVTVWTLSLQAKEGSGASAESAPAATAETKRNPEWMDLNTSLQTLKTKIKMSEDAIEKLIDEKQKTKGEKQSAEIVKNLKLEYKVLKETTEEYEQKRNQLRYRFPEAGVTDEREYERLEVKSLEEMENELTLGGRLKKTFARVKKQYPKSAQEIQKKEKEEKKSHKSSEKHEGSGGKNENPLAQPGVLTK